MGLNPDTPTAVLLTEDERDAIIAELMLSVYESRELARRRLAGLEPVPVPHPAALELLRRARLDPDVHRPSEAD